MLLNGSVKSLSRKKLLTTVSTTRYICNFLSVTYNEIFGSKSNDKFDTIITCVLKSYKFSYSFAKQMKDLSFMISFFLHSFFYDPFKVCIQTKVFSITIHNFILDLMPIHASFVLCAVTSCMTVDPANNLPPLFTQWNHPWSKNWKNL